MPENTQGTGVAPPRGPIGDTEARLRSTMEQEGLLPIRLDYDVQPVVLVQDATLPGYSQYRGKRWWKTFTGLVTGQNAALAPASVQQTGFLVEQLIIQTAGSTAVVNNADVINAYQYQAGSVPPIVPATSDVQFVENYAGDFAPILSGAGAGAPAVTAFAQFQIPLQGALIVRVSWFIKFGTVLTFRWVASIGGTLTLNVSGRTF